MNNRLSSDSINRAWFDDDRQLAIGDGRHIPTRNVSHTHTYTHLPFCVSKIRMARVWHANFMFPYEMLNRSRHDARQKNDHFSFKSAVFEM